jgi:hypothetical protein
VPRLASGFTLKDIAELLGLLAAGILLTGKFHYDNDAAMYLGLALLVAASLWNTWPRSRSDGAACPSCEISVLDMQDKGCPNTRRDWAFASCPP